MEQDDVRFDSPRHRRWPTRSGLVEVRLRTSWIGPRAKRRAAQWLIRRPYRPPPTSEADIVRVAGHRFGHS
jgi:hypothetical protein